MSEVYLGSLGLVVAMILSISNHSEKSLTWMASRMSIVGRVALVDAGNWEFALRGMRTAFLLRESL